MHRHSFATSFVLATAVAVGLAGFTSSPAEVSVRLPQQVTGVAPSGFASASVGELRAITPVRSVDTRAGLGGPAFTSGESRTITLDDVVPPGTTAVSLNLTAVAPTDSTYLTVWPAGSGRPVASNLNVPAGATRPNAVLVGVSEDRTIEIYNDVGNVDVLVDVMGYSTGSFRGIRPHRALDTRSGLGGTTLGPGATRRLTVADVAGVPPDAAAVAVNVTGTGADRDTYLAAWPTGGPRPATSNLNLVPGDTRANLAIVGVGPDGTIEVGNEVGTVDVIVDLLGWFDSDGDLTPFTPRRALDTRTPECDLRLGPGETRRVVLGPVGGGAHVVNVTAVGATRPTHLRVFPSGADLVATSNVNVADGGATANAVVVGSGADGAIDIYNAAGNVHLIVDLFGSTGVGGPPSASLVPGPPASCPGGTDTPLDDVDRLNDTERELIEAINATRATHGRTPLQSCPRLSVASRSYAEYIAATGTLSHTGPDGSGPGARAMAAGYGSTIVGENLALGHSSVAAVVSAWMASPGHRTNLLTDLPHIGLGVVAGGPSGTAWVLKFGAGGSCS